MSVKKNKSFLYSLLVTEIIVGLLVAVISFLLFAYLSREVLSQEILAFDHQISQMIYAWRNPFLTSCMFLLTSLGGNIALTVISVSVLAFLLYRKYRREAVLFAITFGMGVALNLLIKQVIARARPDMSPLVDEIFYSYPSGHSMNAFVLYALLAYFFFHFTNRIKLGTVIGCLLLVLILGIGLSRIYLGVHYPSDVLAGFFAGACWFVTVLVVDRTLQAYHIYRKKN